MRIFLILLFFSFKSFTVFGVDTKAEQAIVVDYNTNEILFEKNSQIKVPPASMTKIMTVYAIFDRLLNTDLSLAHLCTISAKSYKMGGSRTFLEIDDRVSIENLLKGIIVQSGNDASVAIAECLVGTESNFAKLMNAYAKKLGMNDTNFINSSGWPHNNHFSTAHDLAILSNSLIKNFPDLYNYFSLKEFTYNQINQPNRNKLLTNILGVDGLKTGYTKKSGWGIAVSAIRNNRRVTVVINGTNSTRSRLNESTYLLDWAFTQTSQKKILSKNQVIKNIDVWLGNNPSINLVADNDIISILSFDQIQLINSTISYSKPINAPIKKGDKLGELTINISGKKSINVPLVADSNIGKINPFLRVFAALKYLIFGTSLDEE